MLSGIDTSLMQGTGGHIYPTHESGTSFFGWCAYSNSLHTTCAETLIVIHVESALISGQKVTLT